MKARVAITLKAGILDPQGKAIESALASLGVAGVSSVRQGKLFDIDIATHEPEAAEAALDKACRVLLANLVVEDYSIAIDPSAQPQTPLSEVVADISSAEGA